MDWMIIRSLEFFFISLLFACMHAKLCARTRMTYTLTHHTRLCVGVCLWEHL